MDFSYLSGGGGGELTVQKHISFFIDRIHFASGTFQNIFAS